MLGTAAAIAAGVGALGGIGGAISGARGTPGTAPAGPDELQLQKDAIQQYMLQRQAIDQQQQSSDNLNPLVQQAMQNQGNVLNGSAFQATPDELNNINNLRNAQIQLGTQDFRNQFQDLTNQTNASAGIRGLRGQAVSQLQGMNQRTMGTQLGNIVNTAGVNAAQQAIQDPYRRVAAQSQVGQGLMGMQNQLQQQAILNRQYAANPGIMNYFQNGRIGSRQPVGGGLAGAIGGGLAGAAGGFNMGVQGYNAYNNLGLGLPTEGPGSGTAMAGEPYSGNMGNSWMIG